MPIAEPQRTFVISPSDLPFLLLDCFRCFYLKVAKGVRRPASPFPATFSAMDRLQRDHYDGQSGSIIDSTLGPGTLHCGDEQVRSAPISFPSTTSSIVFRGALDATVHFDDGQFALIDFKTTNPSATHVDKYTLQLHAYALALERPAPGGLSLSPVRTMGLLCFNPVEMIELDDGGVAFRMERSWLPMEREDDSFLVVMEMVCQMLESDDEPAPAPRCEICRLR